jgi:hypothetical protein
MRKHNYLQAASYVKRFASQVSKLFVLKHRSFISYAKFDVLISLHSFLRLMLTEISAQTTFSASSEFVAHAGPISQSCSCQRQIAPNRQGEGAVAEMLSTILPRLCGAPPSISWAM